MRQSSQSDKTTPFYYSIDRQYAISATTALIASTLLSAAFRGLELRDGSLELPWLGCSVKRKHERVIVGKLTVSEMHFLVGLRYHCEFNSGGGLHNSFDSTILECNSLVIRLISNPNMRQR
jgi:hypothetical protein